MIYKNVFATSLRTMRISVKNLIWDLVVMEREDNDDEERQKESIS